MSTPSSELPLTEQVQHRVDERGIAYITLNRPDVKNAISPDQRDRVIALLGEASADLGVRAVVLGHTGDAFCTGADLRASRPPAPRPSARPWRAGPAGAAVFPRARSTPTATSCRWPAPRKRSTWRPSWPWTGPGAAGRPC